MTALPTPAEMLTHADFEMGVAYQALSDAADWLRSDWPPGHTLNPRQAEQRTAMHRAIIQAKAAIERARL